MNTTPIEFMAWSTELSMMLTHSEIDNMDKDGLEFWSDVLKCSNGLFPLQLTALRSIKDEPIYNHMIVKSKAHSYFVVDMFDYAKMYGLSILELKIVGNRFQNPELLELCK